MSVNFKVGAKKHHKAEEPCSRPDLIDERLESHELRKDFNPGEGRLAVTIEPGEDFIGQLTINTQFEGKFVEGAIAASMRVSTATTSI